MDWQKCISSLQAAGVSVDQIAGEIGVTGNAIREVVAGRTKAPRANAALKLLDLCQKHGVTPTEAEPNSVDRPVRIDTPEAVAAVLPGAREQEPAPQVETVEADAGDVRVEPFVDPP